jgi:hypothetical protein
MNVFQPRWRSHRTTSDAEGDRVSGKHLSTEPGKPGEGFSGLSGCSGEGVSEHAPAHPCVSCCAEVSADVLYCPPCWGSRQARGRVLQFDATRRARAHARLKGRSCRSCGQEDWHVVPRGDASCVVCFKDWKPILYDSEVPS